MNAHINRNRVRQFKMVAAAAIALISVAGCGLGKQRENVSVDISPNGSQSLAAGQTLSFTATVTNDTGTDGVPWAMLS